MKLSIARAIHRHAQKTPLMALKCIQEEGEGEFENGYWQMVLDGQEYNHYAISATYRQEGQYHVAHCVYGSSYGEGDSPKAAMSNFIERAPKIKADLIERKKKRKLAAKIVEKYGPGPEVTQEGATWVARLDGEIVGKAANYTAAMKMGERAEKAQA